ncbi:MAG: hypothetical protein IPM24_27585 [Bryobacterales bacterium]|jgi:hypothetical protein|nr:hypothetical protein [Bryobacterales bacterium]
MRLPVVALLAASFPCLSLGQGGGITSEWDIRGTLKSVSSQVGRIEPILEQVRAKEWVERGAPRTYVEHWESARGHVEGVRLAGEALSEKPQKLSIAMDLFFRLQALDRLVGSLAEGLNKYQNPALAELLAGLLRESSESREGLRHYIMELAEYKEQEFEVMDKEAQRCRGVLVSQPPPRPAKPKP